MIRFKLSLDWTMDMKTKKFLTRQGKMCCMSIIDYSYENTKKIGELGGDIADAF